MRQILIGLACLAALSGELKSQTYWRFSSAASGGVWGTMWGVVIEETRTLSCTLSFTGPGNRCEKRPWVPVTMGAIGTLIGFKGGWDADVRLAYGDTLSESTRFRLQSQLVLTPMLIGAAATASVTPERTRQKLTVAAVGGGLVAGVILRHTLQRALWPNARVSIAPTHHGAELEFSTTW